VIALRKAEERGHADYGWLDTWHSFSFADYYDPRHMGFGTLRVINEDRVAPGKGFPTHGHRDMEILTYVLQGALEHRDSMGNGSVIRPGDVQRMSAGTGVTHSEHNASRSEPVHLLQIWIVPRFRGIRPGYEQKTFPAAEKRGKLRLVASPDGREGSVTIHQDAFVYATLLEKGESVRHALVPGRKGYVHVARGTVTANGRRLAAGDALGSEGEDMVLEAAGPAEVLVFDL
jgi:redox-sensitive bicupin YhaK (pirin superfamily)